MTAASRDAILDTAALITATATRDHEGRHAVLNNCDTEAVCQILTAIITGGIAPAIGPGFIGHITTALRQLQDDT